MCSRIDKSIRPSKCLRRFADELILSMRNPIEQGSNAHRSIWLTRADEHSRLSRYEYYEQLFVHIIVAAPWAYLIIYVHALHTTDALYENWALRESGCRNCYRFMINKSHNIHSDCTKLPIFYFYISNKFPHPQLSIVPSNTIIVLLVCKDRSVKAARNTGRLNV